jgi:hypothetical protein
MVSTGLVIGSYTDCNLYITSKQGIGTQGARVDCLTTCTCIALVLQHLTSSFNQILAFFFFRKTCRAYDKHRITFKYYFTYITYMYLYPSYKTPKYTYTIDSNISRL